MLIRPATTADLDAINADDLLFHDFKTALQEVAQANGLQLPEYQVLEEIGPDHDKKFVVEVKLTSQVIARGIGSSKKEAQQQAAREALQLYREQSAKESAPAGSDA